MTQDADNQVQRQFGAEPIIVIGININGNFIYFGDRDNVNFRGRITEVQNLDNVINISQNAAVASVAVQFIDVDGALKDLFDHHDLHKRPCRIYQYFPETDFDTDKILLFDGQLATPITYDEAKMTLSLTGLSKLEDIEVGFSPDNAIWRHIVPNEIEPQAWPMPFGTPVNYPLPQITKEPYGSLIHGFGIPDISSPYAINARRQFGSDLEGYGALAHTATSVNLFKIQNITTEITQLEHDLVYAQERYAEITATLQERLAEISEDQQHFQPGSDADPGQLADFAAAIELAQAQAYEAATYSMNTMGFNYGSTEYSDGSWAEPLLIAQLERLEQAQYDWQQAQQTYQINIQGANTRLSQLRQEYQALVARRQKYDAESERASAAAFAAAERLAAEEFAYDEQKKYDPTGKQIAIWNGQSFPGDRSLWLKIGSALVYGRFTHQIQSNDGGIGYFKVKEVVHPETCNFTGKHCTELIATVQKMFPAVEYGQYQSIANMTARAVWQENQEGQEDLPDNITNPNATLTTGPPHTWPVNQLFTSSWASQMIGRIRGSRAGFAWVDSGSSVRIAYGNPVEFVLSIIPCQLKRLAAYRTYAGQKHLATIPPKWYTVETRDYGDGLIATVIILKRPLDMLVNTGFESQLFATVTSSVGPNVVDVIRYLVEKYLPGTVCDTTTFTQVRAETAGWPVHFVLLTRLNIIELLSSICYQACLGIWFSEGVVFLRYLPNLPARTVQLTDDSIDAETLQISYTPTEDVITKLVASYKTSYDMAQPNRLAARYNISKYGTVEQSTDYFIYNYRSAVVRSVTFWLIRKANTWKYLEFTTSLDTLVFETMDAVTIQLRSNFAADEPVTGIIEQTQYDSETFTLTYRVWLPVRAGEMHTYKFAYYNVGDIYDEFPDPRDWATGNGLGPPVLRDMREGAVGGLIDDNNYIPQLHASPEQRAVERYPKAGHLYISEDINRAESYPEPDAGYGDGPELLLDFGDEYIPGDLSDDFIPQDIIGGPVIDAPAPLTNAAISLQNTLIRDEYTGETSVLASFFRNIVGRYLQIRTNVRVSQNEDAGDGTFELLPISDTTEFGAKAAFLFDDRP